MYFLPSEFAPGSPRPTHERIAAALAMGLDASGEWEEQRFDEPEPRLQSPYRWPSTLRQLDSRCGGFTGVSYLAAPPKVGKSILALASALEAAATLEWRVVYLNAELTRSDIGGRVDRYIEAHPAAEDALPLFVCAHVSRGLTCERLHELVLSCLAPDQMRLLIVVDSINRIADMSGRDYLRVLGDFGLYLMTARRLSEGVVSGLVVSELNKRGSDKGERGAYMADMLLRIQPTKEPHWVDIDVAHARHGGDGFVGRFLRDWQRGVFAPQDEVMATPLRAVHP